MDILYFLFYNNNLHININVYFLKIFYIIYLHGNVNMHFWFVKHTTQLDPSELFIPYISFVINPWLLTCIFCLINSNLLFIYVKYDICDDIICWFIPINGKFGSYITIINGKLFLFAINLFLSSGILNGIFCCCKSTFILSD